MKIRNLLTYGTLIFLSVSCNNFVDDTPKCSDPKVTNLVLEILSEKHGDGVKNAKLENFMTVAKDKEIKKCDCEATIIGSFYSYRSAIPNVINPSISYSAQKNDEDKLIVSVMPIQN